MIQRRQGRLDDDGLGDGWMPTSGRSGTFADHFSGPGKAIGRVCVYVCVSGLTSFELNDI